MFKAEGRKQKAESATIPCPLAEKVASGGKQPTDDGKGAHAGLATAHREAEGRKQKRGEE
jgi:hypothetical protein